MIITVYYQTIIGLTPWHILFPRIKLKMSAISRIRRRQAHMCPWCFLGIKDEEVRSQEAGGLSSRCRGPGWLSRWSPAASSCWGSAPTVQRGSRIGSQGIYLNEKYTAQSEFSRLEKRAIWKPRGNGSIGHEEIAEKQKSNHCGCKSWQKHESDCLATALQYQHTCSAFIVNLRRKETRWWTLQLTQI